MVSEWEKEELGRLTLRNLKAVAQPDDCGKMTHQNLQSLKGAHKKTETKEVKIQSFFQRLLGSVTHSFTSLLVPRLERKGMDPCEAYGHNWVSGSSWEGTYPHCLDCGAPIEDASQLRGAMTKEERFKYKPGRR